ncbi:hypothetical protein BpHYR1_048302 [Brachionus plicatilis]|uniref:Uncharacterized protein n=1 Tax=Brachionus plicatilis TaxID=10195 RepID=A0A3M7Q999_BRAPC|nr:hypothetical protein BpHYR1_048302 [Brachionus plicatilis]
MKKNYFTKNYDFEIFLVKFVFIIHKAQLILVLRLMMINSHLVIDFNRPITKILINFGVKCIYIIRESK